MAIPPRPACHRAPPATGPTTRGTARIGVLLAAVLAAPVVAAEPIDLYTELFARYAADGRSMAEIHLSTSGEGPATRTQAQADGSIACRIGGLPVPGPASAARAGRRLLAALLVHEVTHCLTGPFLGPLISGAADAEARRADLLLGLTAEAVSDAAAVIAVFRHDGVDAAAALVTAMRPARIWAPSRAHETVPALNGALAFVRATPQAVATPLGAFEAALGIGAGVARRAVPDAPPALLALQQQALAQAREAFAAGRYANDAFTWRGRDDRSTAGDRHVFLGGAGPRDAPALGAEGAHAHARLRALLAEDGGEPQRLAVRWLTREGDLQPHTLVHTRAIVGRFLASLSQGDADDRTRLAALLEQTIDACCPGADIATVLDVTVEQWRAR